MSAQIRSSNMIIRKKAPVDPGRLMLEAEGEVEPNILEVLPELKQKTERVHVGWLFHVKGTLALKYLLLPLDSTSDSLCFVGWRDLAYHLQLDTLTIKCIKSKIFAGNTETYYTLLAVAQNPERTLCHVLEALHTIKRYDVIQESWEFINNLADYVLENHTSANSTEIIMPPEIERPPSLVFIPDEQLRSRMADSVHPDEQTSLLKSPLVQKLLELLMQPPPIQQKILEYTAPRICNAMPVASAPIEERPSPPPIKKSIKKKPYDCIVMLTFASDGERYIPDIVESLRRERPDNRRIGVLVLEEHSTKVELGPREFIENVFNQVNYTLPVITEGYLKSIVDVSQEAYIAPNNFLDTKWTRYIYTLMNSDYVRRGCLNKKVRCVVPDDLVSLTQTHRRLREPIFETWDRLSNIEKIGDRLLANTKQRT